MYKTRIIHQKHKIEYTYTLFCGASKFNSVEHYFLWRTRNICATEPLISVAHCLQCATE